MKSLDAEYYFQKQKRLQDSKDSRIKSILVVDVSEGVKESMKIKEPKKNIISKEEFFDKYQNN